MTHASKKPAEFDAYSASYDGAVNKALNFIGAKVDFFTRVKADYVIELIEQRFHSTQNIDALDIGCGVGNYHPLLQGKLASLSGVDVSSRCVEEAKKKNPDGSYFAYDGSRLPFEDGAFDVAFTICVMHHVAPQQRRSFVQEAKRVLKPGGLFVVFEHNPLNPLTRRVVSNCDFDKDAVLLKPKETCALLDGAGFGLIKSRRILSIPPSTPLLRRIDSVLGLAPFGAQYYVVAVAP